MSLKFCNTTSFQMNTLKKVLYNSNTLALTRLTIKKNVGKQFKLHETV